MSAINTLYSCQLYTYATVAVHVQCRVSSTPVPMNLLTADAPVAPPAPHRPPTGPPLAPTGPDRPRPAPYRPHTHTPPRAPPGRAPHARAPPRPTRQICIGHGTAAPLWKSQELRPPRHAKRARTPHIAAPLFTVALPTARPAPARRHEYRLCARARLRRRGRDAELPERAACADGRVAASASGATFAEAAAVREP